MNQINHSTQLAFWKEPADFPNLVDFSTSNEILNFEIKMPISAGKVRFCLPNRYGTKPLSCKEIVLTLPNGNKYLITYDNQKQIVIPAQQDLWTDWLNCSLNAGDWLRFEAKLTIKQPQTLLTNIDRLALKTYPKVHKQTWMISGIEVQTESNYNSLVFFWRFANRSRTIRWQSL